jgi:hypothetical protein
MTLGTGIFLASLVLGSILLFGLTKDRWNWAKILRRFAFGSLGLTAVGIVTILAWKAVQDARETEAAAKASLAQQVEARARTCVAADLPRMEKIARSIQGAVREDMKLEEVKALVDKLAGSIGELASPQDDIKEQVLVYVLPTGCEAAFHFLVNVRADNPGALRWFRVWAQDTPAGYPAGLHAEFSTGFEQIRLDRARHGLDAETNAVKVQRKATEKPLTDPDPCAPNLPREERMRRLSAFGRVRQEGSDEFTAGNHRLSFLLNSLVYCN